MSQNANIESTFRNAFDNFEADVNPQVWTNIEQHLPAPAAQPAAHAGAEAIKTIVTGSKFSAIGFSIASTVVIGVIALSYYFLKEEPISDVVIPPSVVVSSANSQTENSNTSSASNTITKDRTADTKPENALQTNATVAKQNKMIYSKPVVSAETAININTDLAQEVAPAKNQNVITKTVNPVLTETSNNTTDPVKQDASSADEKHENISPPAADYSAQPTVNADKSANIADSFDWGKITNVITPNGDGNNDQFKLTTQNISTIFIVIQDRSGKNIFQWNGIEGYWEGKDLKGNEMPAGVYYYYIFATSKDEQTHKKQGSITLLR